MRDYGIDGQIGLEPTWREYVQRLTGVLREVKRTLKPEGSLWIVLGDTFAGSHCSWGKKQGHQKQDVQSRDPGYPAGRPPAAATGYDNVTVPKQKLGIPFRVRFALMEDGWICRNDVVWHKPNHMPDSVKDRLTCSWEWVGHFTKQRKYYFNLDAIREPHKSLKTLPGGSKRNKTSESPNLTGRRLPPEPAAEGAFHELGKNPGDFWSLSPETRSLGAITGVRGAVKVPGGAGWQGHVRGGGARIVSTRDSRWLSPNGKNPGDMWEITTTHFKGAHFAVFPEQLCVRPILATCPPGGIVVDPFAGSGTVSVVARRLGRKYLLIDVNPDYCALARAHLKESGEC